MNATSHQHIGRRRPAAHFLLLIALALTATASQAQPPSQIRSAVHRKIAFELQFTGAVEHNYVAQASSNFTSWNPVGAATEIIPGFYQFTDTTVASHSARFHRIASAAPPGPPSWGDFYEATPQNGATASPLPAFSWLPYPGLPGEVLYEFNLYAFQPGRGDSLIPAARPLLTVNGLVQPSYTFQSSDPELNPTLTYAFNVNAITPFGTTIGRSFFFHCYDGSVQSTDWEHLLRLLRALQEQLDQLQDELEENPLVSEAQLIQQLIAFLLQHQNLQGFLKALADGRLDQLQSAVTDVNQLIQILEYLQKLLAFLRQHDDRLTASQQAGLAQLSSALDAIIQQLKAGAPIQDIWDDLQEFVDDLRGADGSNPLGAYLSGILNLLADKLLDLFKQMVAKKIGEAATSSIFSILTDLSNLTQVILTVSNIDALRAEINRLLLEAIANDTQNTFTPGGRVTFPSGPAQDDCTVTVSFQMFCWKPAAGGGPNEGAWQPSDIPFAGGGTSRSARVGDLPTSANGGREFRNPLDPGAVRCPPGAGPCLVVMTLKLECGGTVVTTKTFAGVIKCG